LSDMYGMARGLRYTVGDLLGSAGRRKHQLKWGSVPGIVDGSALDER